MITENTLENRERFFAQYFDQEIMENHLFKELGNKRKVTPFLKGREDCHINLRSLSLISEKDAKAISPLKSIQSDIEDKYIIENVSYLKNMRNITIYFKYKDNETPDDNEGFGHSSFTVSLNHQFITDYLRSKGYALAWMDLSVNNLLEYGWIKLIESE